MKVWIALLLLFSITYTSNAQSKTKKVVFIIVDGIPADVIEEMRLPHLTAIAKEGGYIRSYLGGEKNGYSETPTISAVGYNSLLTGTWANKHNVWGNSIKAPNYNYWTLFRMMRESFPQKKLGIYSTWLDNRTKLLGTDLPQTGKLKMDYAFDGYELDTLTFPHDEESDYIHRIDELVAQKAAEIIRRNGPDMNWVYLQYTDDMGHHYGDSKQFAQAIRYADGQVGKVYEAIQYRMKQFPEDWLIFVTTDHGRDAAMGMNHGGQSIREKTTFIVTNSKTLNNYFYRSRPAVVDITSSVIDFMDIKLSKDQERELDGVSLIKPVSIANLFATMEKDKLHIGWEAYDTTGKVKLYITSTNNFKTGGKDEYKLLGEAKVMRQKFEIPFRTKKGTTYKIVAEGLLNTINRWLVIPD